MSLSVFAQTDPNEKLTYCEAERDQAEKTVDAAKNTIRSCEALSTSLNNQVGAQKEIIAVQKDLIVRDNKQIDSLQESSLLSKILWGVAGVVVGLVLHIPLALIAK